MKLSIVRLMLIAALVLPFGAALAQEVTVEPTLAPTEEVTVVPTVEPTLPPVVDPVPEQPPPVFEAPTPEAVLNVFYLALLAVFSTAMASPLTEPLANVLKRLPPLQRLSGNWVNLIVAVGLSLITWGGAMFGITPYVDKAYELIYAVVPILFGIGGNFAGNKLTYAASRWLDIPIAGFARTPPVKTIVVTSKHPADGGVVDANAFGQSIADAIRRGQR